LGSRPAPDHHNHSLAPGPNFGVRLNHNAEHGGKPWEYALIAHNKIAENMTLEGLVALKAQ
jgi:hypothetical protein